MSKVWQIHEARARFSEFLEASVSDGPQIVTKRGVETAVPLPIDQWRLRAGIRPTLKELLLSPDARTETLVPLRTWHYHRLTARLGRSMYLFDTDLARDTAIPTPQGGFGRNRRSAWRVRLVPEATAVDGAWYQLLPLSPRAACYGRRVCDAR